MLINAIKINMKIETSKMECEIVGDFILKNSNAK